MKDGEPNPIFLVNFFRSCFNAHERGPPGRKGKTFLSRITPAVKCVLIGFLSCTKPNTAKKDLIN